ncbi:MAG: 30S ribosomal protein S1 [Candidatus Promineifilaceae bacterium]|jgi:small subunit ribosomal protein S1
MNDTSSGSNSHPMDFLLDEELNFPVAGEVRSGTVVSHNNNEILVDIGAKSEGVIDSKEVSTFDDETLARLEVGNEIYVYVVNPEDSKGNIVLSYSKAAEVEDWERAAKSLENQDVIKCKVLGFNRGGALVGYGLLRGFVPNSQLSRDRQISRNDQTEKQRALQNMIGETLKVKVIEVDRERNRLILSENAAGKEIREARKAELLEDMEEGTVLKGQVVNLADFGAFVDIGGIEGLVHLSEMSWKRISKPSDLLKVGDEVEVVVLNVDEDRQRIALSMKRLQPDPWSLIDDTYEVGQLIEVTITRLTKFGAFARLQDDYQLEGLIHISEMSEGRVENAQEIVKPNDTVMVRIIRIDPDQRQLGLSLKQVSSDRYIENDLAMLDSLS